MPDADDVGGEALAPARETSRPGLFDELARLRARAPELTNQTIARRASAMAPPNARWRVDDRRLGEWLGGKSVPHRFEALLAVVTVLWEQVAAETAAAGAGPRSRAGGSKPDRRTWHELWREARVRPSAQAPAAPAPRPTPPDVRAPHEQPSPAEGSPPRPSTQPSPAGGALPRPEGGPAAPEGGPAMPDGAVGGLSLLDTGACPARLRETADRLAADVRDYVSQMAAEATLLVPTPLSVRWRRQVLPGGDGGDAPAGHVLHGLLPGHDARPSAGAGGGRAELLELYASGGSGRVVVTGGPGAGKTCSALLLVLDALAERERLDGGPRAATPVPVFLRLPTWDPVAQDLEDWVVDEISRALTRFTAPRQRAELRELLGLGLVSLVLDGLDEMPDDVRGVALRTLIRRARSRVVVLGRLGDVVDAAGSSLLAGSTVVRLLPLEPGEVVDYLRRCGQDVGQGSVGPDGRAQASPGAAAGLTTPLAVALARDRGPQEGGPTGDGVEATGLWLAEGSLQRAFDGSTPAARTAARRTIGLLAQRMTTAGVHEFDWSSLPSLLVARSRIALVAGLIVGGSVAIGHGLLAWLHHASSSRTLVFLSACPDLTWQGRLAHDLGAAAAQALGLGAVTAVLVMLRVPPRPGSRARSFGPLTRLTRSPTALAPLAVTTAAVLGAGAAVTLWLLAGLALGGTHRVLDTTGCSVAPFLVPPEPLAQTASHGAALGALLGGVTILALRLAHRVGGRRGAVDPAGLWRDTVRAVVASAAAAGVLSQALPRRVSGDGYAAVFVPRADLPLGATWAVGAADGVVLGLEVGLAAGLALGLVAAVGLGSSALNRPARAGGWRWRWAPAIPVRPAAILVLLGLSAVTTVLTLQALTDGQTLPWLASVVAVPLATWLLLRRRPQPAGRVRSPAAALADDRRFALAVGGAVLLVAGPLVLALVLRNELVIASFDEASAIRVAACVLTTTVTSALVVASTFAVDPPLRAADVCLRGSAGAGSDLHSVVTRAHEHGVLWAVGPAFRFRHRSLQEHLAAAAPGGPGAARGQLGLDAAEPVPALGRGRHT